MNTENQSNIQATNNQPDYTVYRVDAIEGSKDRWTKVGVAFDNKIGLSLILNGLEKDLRFVIKENSQDM